MYLRVCSIAGDPAGRGPMATICRRCSQAREESNLGAVCPDAAIEVTTINAEPPSTQKAVKKKTLRTLRLCVESRDLTIAYLWERNRASPGPYRSASGGRSSAPNP